MSPVPPRWRLVVASRAFCALVGSAEVSLHCRPRRLAGSSWAPRAQGGSAKVWPRCHPRRVAGPSSHLPRFPRVLSLPVSFGSRLRHLGALLRVALRAPPPILPHPPWEPQRSLPLFLLGSFTLSSSRSFRFRAPPLGIFVGPLRPSGGHPGLSWSPLGTSWSSLDGLLGHLGATLEVLEALLERCEPREVWKRTVLNPVSMRMSDVAFMWPSWGHLGALLGRHRGLLSRIGAILMSWSAFGLSWTPLGPCWALLQGLLARLVASGRWKRHTGNPRARKSAPEI